jgi:hypothetical protein
MLNQNKLYIGLILGTAIPFVGFALLLEVFDQLDKLGLLSGEGFAANFRQRTTALIAICLNLIPFQLYNRLKYTQSMRGVALPTVFYGILWFVWFGKELF